MTEAMIALGTLALVILIGCLARLYVLHLELKEIERDLRAADWYRYTQADYRDNRAKSGVYRGA